jgi:hypothetical protein
MSDTDKPLVVGMTKAEHLLDSGADKLYDLIKAGELDSYLDGNRRKVTIASIERYVRKQLAASSSGFQRGQYPLRQSKEIPAQRRRKQEPQNAA